MKQTCTCPCGASRFVVDGDPIGRFLCHCTICQRLYAKPYADVTCFWAKSISLAQADAVAFRRHRAPPALRRGACRECGAPVINLLGPHPIAVAFAPAHTFENRDALPRPSMHIFYERRVADVPDSIPKVSGYWPSEISVTRMIFGGLLGFGRNG